MFEYQEDQDHDSDVIGRRLKNVTSGAHIGVA